jgi:putative membrane protein
MSMTKLIAAALAATVAMPALAQMPALTPTDFVMQAGASDKFEISEAKLMQNSKNADVRSFANKMITDHTKSTAMVKSAAMKDGLHPTPPVLNSEQQSNLAQLKSASGSARDSLYIQQQKPAHQQALALMQSYSSTGTATHLKDAAGQIQPVVQSHLDMLNQMPMPAM